MPRRLTCPTCGVTLTVSDAAPARLTCPKCLGRIDNPSAGKVLPAPPLRVIPVDEETRFDSKVSIAMIVLVTALVVVGSLIMLSTLDAPGFTLVVLALVLAVGGAAVARVALRGGPAPAPAPATSPYDSQAPGSPPVLHYASHRAQREPARLGAFALGFFAALGICAAGFLALAATVDLKPKSLHPLLLTGVIVGVAGGFILNGVVARRIGGRGYGAGTITGMILGLMALAPCGLCYLMTF
jgi:hypothetical protein